MAFSAARSLNFLPDHDPWTIYSPAPLALTNAATIHLDRDWRGPMIDPQVLDLEGALAIEECVAYDVIVSVQI